MGPPRLFALLLFLPLIGAAAEEVPPPSEELPKAEVIIRKEGKRIVEEYRLDGRIYMIRIVPPVGPPYYLVDVDGDGNLEVRRSDLDRGLRVHQWKLLEW